MKFLTTTQRGDIGETAFLLAATIRNLLVSKPFGNAEGYDFVVDNGVRLIKVQVKAARWIKSKKYDVLQFGLNSKSRGVLVTRRKFDVLVCYDIDKKDFYIMPANKVKRQTISMSSDTLGAPYKNNWSIFK